MLSAGSQAQSLQPIGPFIRTLWKRDIRRPEYQGWGGAGVIGCPDGRGGSVSMRALKFMTVYTPEVDFTF